MGVALTKRNQSFRLPVDLIDRLKLMAKRQNRSLNNFVETLLLDAAYHEPNAETLAAMEEARSGKLRDVPALVSVGREDLMMTPELQRRIEEARAELKTGKTLHFENAQSAIDWMNEL